ncbi:polyadenylate-binding protein RBP45-like isoform X1 [Salvia splendens]|uniref:polyadenylate-binding protein RBP45-like isoform X1 n=1 Tax=Salvia splendens TaxID=180675 RepID=UPI001C26A390|nr:polyadenylate-binding protein RBP45-like isoform X1 [Salvia splendens]
MMQPASSMVPPPMAPPPQYQQQPPPQHPSQQWMPQQPQYQVPPPQQPPAAGYYYQQAQVQAPAFPPQHPQQYAAAPAAQPQAIAEDGIRSLWIGDLQYWMDEQYLYSCFGTGGEVVSAKVIRNKQSGQSEGYGFIEFSSHAAAERNLQTYNGALMPNVEQTFRLNWASMGAGEKRDDGPEYTVFVGDLASDVTDYILQETFRANYPSVKGAKVVTDRVTGRTKGYGFVRFGDESEQMRAMTEMNGRFCSNRPMRIGPAANKQKVGGGQTKASYQTSQGTPSEDDPTNTTIFIGNLDPNVNDELLRQVFGQHGQLLHVKIPVGKRCGFVQYAERSCAEDALRVLNGTPLGGQSIRLSWGRSPSNKQPQVDPNQWSGSGSGSGSGYYGYAPGYETYGYAPAAQDPNMYYAGYPGYANYPPQQQQQMMQQPQ